MEESADVLMDELSENLDQDAKRKFASERQELEQQVKRTKLDPEYLPLTEEKRQEILQDMFAVFWEHQAEVLLAEFAKWDFDRVFHWMRSFPAVNRLVRRNVMFWKRRAILEYPDYWSLYRDPQRQELRETTVSRLLEEAQRGQSPLALDRVSASDAYYLFYQKARRLTRFISRLAVGEIASPVDEVGLPRTLHRERVIAFPAWTQQIGRPGRFFATYGNQSVHVFDLANSRGFEVPLPPANVAAETGLSLGSEYMALRYGENPVQVILVHLPSQRPIYDEPITMPPGFTFKGLTPLDYIRLEVAFPTNPHTLMKLTVAGFINWAQYRTGTITEVLNFREDPAVTRFPGETKVEFDRATGKCTITNPAYAGELVLYSPRLASLMGYSAIRLDLANSYEFPLIMRREFYFNNGSGIRAAKHDALDHLYSAQAMEDGVTIPVIDRSNFMRWQSPVVEFAIPLVMDIRRGKPFPVVFADLLYVVLPEKKQIHVYDLWKYYTQTLEDPKKPLITCIVCAEPSDAVCVSCQQTAYCSEACQTMDWSRHTISCKLK